MKSTDQVARILALIPFLQQRQGVPIADVAREFGVSERQIAADLSVIWMVGPPGPGQMIDVDMDAVETDGVIHIGNADVLPRPLRFTPDEALSLLVALQAIRELAGGDLAQVVDAAIAKLQTVAGADADTRVVVATGEQRVRTELAVAVDADVAVELVYDGAARGGTTRPVVDPERLYVAAGVGYLQAWNREASAWRTYRLDRIAEVNRTDLPRSQRPPAPPPSDWTQRLDEAATVTALLEPSARWVAEYYPVSEAVETEGGLRITIPVVDRSWFAALALRLGAGMRIVEDDAAAAVAEAASAALAQYRELGLV